MHKSHMVMAFNKFIARTCATLSLFSIGWSRGGWWGRSRQGRGRGKMESTVRRWFCLALNMHVQHETNAEAIRVETKKRIGFRCTYVDWVNNNTLNAREPDIQIWPPPHEFRQHLPNQHSKYNFIIFGTSFKYSRKNNTQFNWKRQNCMILFFIWFLCVCACGI